MDKLNIAIIGAGRVGTTMANLLKGDKNSRESLKAVTTKTRKSLHKAKEFLGPDYKDVIFTLDNVEAARLSNCLIITTPDDQIKVACDKIFSQIKEYSHKTVIHFSGSKKMEVLDSAKKAGAFIGCMHPIKSFASADQAIKTIKGTVFGLTYSDRHSKQVLLYLIDKLEGDFIEVEDSKKPLYHAACCIVSNYLVALFNYAIDISSKVGIGKKESIEALMPLAEGTLKNILSLGTKKSLTGPIARGDFGTIKEHLQNFSQYDCPDQIYKVMGKKAAEIAHDNQWLNQETYKTLIAMMEDELDQ